MKYRIRKLKDRQPLGEKAAIDLAKNKLKYSSNFAAIYGESINGKKNFFAPELVDEEGLKIKQKEFLQKNPEGRLIVLYRSNLDDAPLYEIDYRNGEAWIDIPDDEVEDVLKNIMMEVINTPRLLKKYSKDLQDIFEKELQDYANDQFFKEGRGKVQDSVYESDEEYDLLSKAIDDKFIPIFNSGKKIEYEVYTDEGPDLKLYEDDVNYDCLEEDYIIFYIHTEYLDKHFDEWEGKASIYLPLKDLGIDINTMPLEECIKIINEIPESKLISMVKDLVYDAKLDWFDWGQNPDAWEDDDRR